VQPNIIYRLLPVSDWVDSLIAPGGLLWVWFWKKKVRNQLKIGFYSPVIHLDD